MISLTKCDKTCKRSDKRVTQIHLFVQHHFYCTILYISQGSGQGHLKWHTHSCHFFELMICSDLLSDWLINDVIHLNYHTWSGPGIGILPPVVAFAIAPVSFLWHALSVVRRWRLVALAVLIPTPVTVIGRLSTIIPPPMVIWMLPINWVRPWGLALRPKRGLTGGVRLTGSVRHTASVRRKAGTYCRAVRRRWRWTEVMPLRLDDVVVLLLHHRHHHLRSGVRAVAVRPVIRCDFSWDWFTSDPLQIS